MKDTSHEILINILIYGYVHIYMIGSAFLTDAIRSPTPYKGIPPWLYISTLRGAAQVPPYGKITQEK